MDNTTPSPMDTQEDNIQNIARSMTPDSSSQAAQLPHATPIRHRGASSAAVSSSKWSTISKTNLDDIAAPIKNEISKPQACKAIDMLRFLFSFCDTRGDAAQVEPKDNDLLNAFEMARNLANKQDTLLRKNLDLVISAKDEGAMYSPLIKAFNYALDQLSKLEVPGLPEFQEERQIVFARSDAKCIESDSYLKGSYKPDIILVKWDVFKRAQLCSSFAYPESYKSYICCESSHSQPTLSWRNLLSTIEVKRGVGTSGKKKSKDKTRAKSIKSEYLGGFVDLEEVLEATGPSIPSRTSKMVNEEYSVRTFPSRSSPRNQESSSSTSTSDRLASASQKRSRGLQEFHGSAPKKPKGNTNVTAGGSSAQRAESPGEPGTARKRPQKQAPKVQSAIYASHKISASFDISHTINLILVGTSIRLTWIDRQNVIESRTIDLVDDLPHFLLLLLILQRFDDAKWGYFSECPESGINIEPVETLTTVSFDADTETGEKITIVFYPDDHEIYLGATLIGRGTSVIGGRRGPSPKLAQLGDTEKLREGNDLVVKTYWPEESRTSEAEILKMAKEYGENIDFIGNHIPDMVCHLDPNFLCSSTKPIRQFLGLSTDGSRRLRIIVFRRLRPIKELKENDMLTAYLQCFFCHFCLWKKGIHHGDISLGNLMWDDRRKVGILNDFDLARFADQTGASGQDNTGTLPFMALDLLSEEGLRGMIPRLYRHEAESFAWSLTCLCLTMVVSENGKNFTKSPHPLYKWFTHWHDCRDAKLGLQLREYDYPGVRLAYPNTKALARDLYKFWVDRYHKQFPEARDTEIQEDDAIMQILKPTMSRPIEIPPYEEPEDENLFRELVVINGKMLRGFEPTKELIAEMSRRYNELDWTL